MVLEGNGLYNQVVVTPVCRELKQRLSRLYSHRVSKKEALPFVGLLTETGSLGCRAGDYIVNDAKTVTDSDRFVCCSSDQPVGLEPAMGTSLGSLCVRWDPGQASSGGY